MLGHPPSNPDLGYQLDANRIPFQEPCVQNSDPKPQSKLHSQRQPSRSIRHFTTATGGVVSDSPFESSWEDGEMMLVLWRCVEILERWWSNYRLREREKEIDYSIP
uniref:Uncharacterized protein n=1 Tax=Kalanchoe fedtschenkoi TaxID=63787 RepID=A0A7N0VHX4_KALFE